MIKQFTRKSDGHIHDHDPVTIDFIHAVDEIISAELNWGAQVEVGDNTVTFTSKVFGVIDNTSFTGNAQEHKFIVGLCENRKNITKYLCEYMRIGYSGQLYKLDDLIAALDLYLQGTNSDTVIELLIPQTPIVRKPVNIEKIVDDTKELFSVLDKDDGARIMLAQAIVLGATQ